MGGKGAAWMVLGVPATVTQQTGSSQERFLWKVSLDLRSKQNKTKIASSCRTLKVLLYFQPNSHRKSFKVFKPGSREKMESHCGKFSVRPNKK